MTRGARRWWLRRRRFLRPREAARLEGCLPEALVRVVGTVQAVGETVLLRLETGDEVRVATAVLDLLEDPYRVRRAPRYASGAGQESGDRSFLDCKVALRPDPLVPGETVEAVGRVVKEVSPAGRRAPIGRGLPVVHRLEPGPDGTVWIRRRS
jgi:hypothetical protein